MLRHVASVLWIASLLIPSAAEAQSARITGELRSGDLVLQGVFTDEREWESLTVLPSELPVETRAEALLEEATSLPAASAAAATSIRTSIDADVLASIIADRAKQIGMMAVADAIAAVDSSLGSRRYVQDLIATTQRLLLDRGGAQRTNIENLVRTVVRLVFAEVIVRLRFSEAHLMNRADHWERMLCRGGSGHRRLTGDALRHCQQLRLGLPSRSVSHRTIHLYLLDLAYWRLGATGLFGATELEPPECPFAFGEEGSGLCQVLVSGASDAERNARVDWVLNLDRILTGLELARTLQSRWRADGTGLRGLLRALVGSGDIGAFGQTVGLRWQDWEATTRLLHQLSELSQTVESLSRYEGLVGVEAGAGLGDPRGDALELRASFEGTQRLFFAPSSGLCRSGSERARDALELCAGGNAAALEEWLGGSVAGIDEALARPGLSPAELRDELRQRLRALEDVAVLGGLRRLRAQLDEVGRAIRRVLELGEGQGAPLEVLEARLRNRMERLGELVWGRSADGDGGRGHVDTSSPRSIGGIDLDDLLELVEELSGFAQTLDAVADALGELPGSVFAWRSTEAGEGVQAAIQAVGGVTRLLRLFSSLNVHAAREARLSSVSSIIRGLESLGIRGRDGSVSTPLLEFLEPVLAHLVEGRPLDSGLLFRLASSIDERAVLAAFGERAASACRDDEGSLACWTVRIVQSLHEATTIGEGGISIDGAVFRTALASLGEDFRARHEWRTYFHLTIGLGELATLGPAPGVLDAMGQPLAGGMRAQPIVSEQIGLGIASPVFFRDRFAFRTGLYASGILFRVALDTEESEALIFGAFAALDLYQLLQVYVSPLLLLYPSEGDAGPAARFGFSAGVQIPLGDYLSAL